MNPTALPDCATNTVLIAAFAYIAATGPHRNCVATTTRGMPITFVNEDANPLGTFSPIAPNPFYLASVFHTVTSCASPCRLDYGIAYPLSNGKVSFDSGELRLGTPGVGRIKWSTPTGLEPGTYTFYCRIHPLMRGVFRILG